MKIAEVLLFEQYFDDLKIAIQDRLAQAVGGDIPQIPTETFRKFLADDGFLLSIDELINALNDMDIVQSVDKDVITPKGNIPNDMAEPEGEEEPEVDVGDMAGDQAMSAVKDQLPQ